MSQSVARALQLLIQLGNGPAGLDELAAATDVHKTTVMRLLRTLSEERFTYRDNNNRYHLGSRIFELAAHGTDQREIRQIASRYLVEFNREYGRTTHLAAMEGGDIVYIDKLESHDQIRMYSRIGLTANLNSTAVAKVILADLSDAELRPIVATMDFTRRAANTITMHTSEYNWVRLPIASPITVRLPDELTGKPLVNPFTTLAAPSANSS